MSTNRERAELILFDLMNRDEEVSNAMFGDEYVSYVDALADDGLLRPDLPKPIINDDDGNPEWHADEYTVDVDRGLVGLWTPDGTHWEQTPTEARLLADALYAAAALEDDGLITPDLAHTEDEQATEETPDSPQPGEAWLIEYEGKRYEAVYWYSPIYAHWAFVGDREDREGLKTIDSPEATPVFRLLEGGTDD